MIQMTTNKKLKTFFYNILKQIYCSRPLNFLRWFFSTLKIKLKYRLDKNNKPLKLHLGCGGRHFTGYENIDIRKTRTTDLVCNIKKLPYPNNSVALIETYHTIEHLPRHDFPRALREWQRVLIPNGKLIIECPDFDKTVQEYLVGAENRLNNIFGLQRFAGDTHLFGYNFKRLKILLEQAGFSRIMETPPQDSHTNKEPCLRIECLKI